jgi:hypothetical protein
MRGLVRVLLVIGNIEADLIVNESLHNVLLASSDNLPVHLRVVWFWPEVLRVPRMPPILKRDQMVFFVAF